VTDLVSHPSRPIQQIGLNAGFYYLNLYFRIYQVYGPCLVPDSGYSHPNRPIQQIGLNAGF
jgi:hypothetical protein